MLQQNARRERKQGKKWRAVGGVLLCLYPMRYLGFKKRHGLSIVTSVPVSSERKREREKGKDKGVHLYEMVCWTAGRRCMCVYRSADEDRSRLLSNMEAFWDWSMAHLCSEWLKWHPWIYILLKPFRENPLRFWSQSCFLLRDVTLNGP